MDLPAVGDTLGKRETNNSTRLFFGQSSARPIRCATRWPRRCKATPWCGGWRLLCGTVLGGSSLRIEYCLDTDGFWLEPHTDIGAKLYTMLIYLSDEPGWKPWGTDMLDGPDEFVASTPYVRNGGLIFIPRRRHLGTASTAGRLPGCGGR